MNTDGANHPSNSNSKSRSHLHLHLTSFTPNLFDKHFLRLSYHEFSCIELHAKQTGAKKLLSALEIPTNAFQRRAESEALYVEIHKDFTFYCFQSLYFDEKCDSASCVRPWFSTSWVRVYENDLPPHK